MTSSIRALVERLKELEAKTTKGPWFVVDDGFSAGIATESLEDRLARGRCGAYPNVCGGDAHEGYFDGPDAEFIAESRNALPLLLSEIERLSGIVGKAKALAAVLGDRVHDPLKANEQHWLNELRAALEGT